MPYRTGYFAMVLMVSLPIHVHSGSVAGLIRTGVDTFQTVVHEGFDFVKEEACDNVLGTNPDCHSHFEVTPLQVPERYMLSVHLGSGLNLGKINLDSVKTAPSDSVFAADGDAVIENMPPDSLSTYIGNVYVIKTGEDPRDDVVYYAKIKILDIIVQDAAEHRVDMVFLWAFNVDGWRDLGTTNLDTFDLDSGAVAVRQNLGMRIAERGLRSGSYGTKRMLTPKGVVVGGRGQVWDLRGRARAIGSGAGPAGLLGSQTSQEQRREAE